MGFRRYLVGSVRSKRLQLPSHTHVATRGKIVQKIGFVPRRPDDLIESRLSPRMDATIVILTAINPLQTILGWFKEALTLSNAGYRVTVNRCGVD